jgi:rhamnose utilization protein RhaD (predicted bifunctional aldolase and dehydrogenase)
MISQDPEEKFRFVKYLWQDEAASQLDGVDRLVYRSNKLGEDLTLTNTGGGNTSSKLIDLRTCQTRWFCVALTRQSARDEGAVSEQS